MNASGRFPSASEVLDVMVRLDRDPHRRFHLQQGYKIFQACVTDGVVGPDGINWVAARMQDLARDELITHGPVNLGVAEPAVWDDYWIQSAHDWRVTAKGRADAALFNREAPVIESGVSPNAGEAPTGNRDVFISHASEDKEAVARPLAAALRERGWTVWLDELELTVGDSLNGTINHALSQSRFGVVVLSPAFFTKQWAMNELAGLAAREVEAGTKVILPVWHEIDRAYLTTRLPILADRLGALTSSGIEDVANKISIALRKAGQTNSANTPAREPVLQPARASDDPIRTTIPATAEAQKSVIATRPEFWEHRLFAGTLLRMRNELDNKWVEHERRLPRGERRDCDDATALAFLDREVQWLRRRMEALSRVLDPATHDAVFGARGQHGNADRIVQLAGQIIDGYEAFLDWAARLRNISAPRAWVPAFDAAAHWVDQPLLQMRTYVDGVVEQVSRMPELIRDSRPGNPAVLDFTLSLSISEQAVDNLLKAMDEASESQM